MATDPLLDHAREFTDIEDQTLDLWLQLELAGLDDQAAKLLDAGLMFEHYTSLLDNDPGKRSIQQLNQQAQLGFHLAEQVRQAESALFSARNRRATRTTARWVLQSDGTWLWVINGG